jgi:hypothetical protein
LDEMGGRTIRKYYTSFYEMLKTVYPEHTWDPFRFPMTQVSLAKNNAVTLEDAIVRLEEGLKLTEPQKWYRVTTKQVQSRGVYYLIQSHGGLYQALKKAKPDYSWEESKFVGVFHDGALLLGAFLRQWFSDLEILSNYTLPKSAFTLTYYIPRLNIGFLYQSVTDYGLSDRTGAVAVETYFDPSLRSASKELGIEVAPIPFWWDRTKEALAGTIIQHCQAFSRDSEALVKERIGQGLGVPIRHKTSVNLSTWRRLK